MALQGPIPVSFGQVFGHGAFAVGDVEPVRDFDRSKGEAFVQERDKASGELVWSLMVLDADPEARANAKTVKVKLIAPHQPVLPNTPAGMPVTPVEFDQMSVTPWVNDQGRLAYSIRAKAVRSPKGGGVSVGGPRKDAAA